MKLRLGFLLPLAVVASTALIAPAHAAMFSSRPTIRPALATPTRRTQVPLDRTNNNSASTGTSKNSTNYIGVGGSNDGVVVNGKYALTNHLAVRPEVFTNAENNGNDRGISVLAPITYDFSAGANQRLQPFVGAGPGVTTGGGSTNAQLVTTAGADYKVGKRYTADASVNYLPFDNSRADFVAGVGYNF